VKPLAGYGALKGRVLAEHSKALLPLGAEALPFGARL
jgi:hypothetical protein